MVLAENQKLLIPSKSENIVLVEKLVDDVCDLFDIKEDIYGHLLVALTEAPSHGRTSRPSALLSADLNVAQASAPHLWPRE